MRKIFILLLISFGLIYGAGSIRSTLDKVKKDGELICGVNSGFPGFSFVNSKGKYEGLDVDYCRALATAVLGSPNKVIFVPLTSQERFTALQSGDIDVLARNTTWTLKRDVSLGLNFAGVTYYDGQGFLVKKSLGVGSAKQLNGASICIQSETTTELNVDDYFKLQEMKYESIVYDTLDQTKKAFEKGVCDAFTSDQSQLYAVKSTLKDPSKYMVLPEIISKEPLGPVVKQGDDRWLNVTKWVIFALLEAEEQGITKANVSMKKMSKNPSTRRLLGQEGDSGKNLGLKSSWAYDMIKAVGNYGEIFERNVGKNTPLAMSRNQNALWTNGGLMYPMPIR